MAELEQTRLRPGALAAVSVIVLLAAAAGALPVWPGVVQLVALPPLDLTADIRLLLVYAPELPVFVVALIILICVRSAVLALLLGGLTWARFGFALRFYLLVLPFAACAAVPVYAAQAMLFYGAFWVGMVLTLVVFAAFAAIPWQLGGRLRGALASAARHRFRLGTLGAYLAALLVLGALADAGGSVGAILAVPASAALTWRAAQSLRHDRGLRAARRVVAALPAAAATILLVLYFAGPDEAPEVDGAQPPRDGSLMLMSGIDSRSGSGAILEIDPGVVGYACDQTHYFSYAGPGDGQPQGDASCEIDHGAEYSGEDTMRSRETLVNFIETQADGLAPPAMVMGHSQGVWLLWDAAARDRLPNVERLVLVGPYPANEVHYPPAGEDGAGRVGRLILDQLAKLARSTGHTVIELDSPLGREWLGHDSAIEDTLARPLASGVEVLSVPSMFDLPLMPAGPRIGGAVNGCPVAVPHPDLPYATQLHDAVNRFLDGEEQAACPPWQHTTGPALRQFTAPPSPR